MYTNELVTNQVFDRMSAFVSGTYADRNGPFAEIIGSYGTYEGSTGTPGLTMHVGGVRAGLDKKDGATLTGASVTMLAGGVSTGSVKSDITSYRADVYSTALFGKAYVSADAPSDRWSYKLRAELPALEQSEAMFEAVIAALAGRLAA